MRRRRDSGFTLVEIMVSLGIMTIAGMAIMALQQQITRANIHARQITTATQIAQNVIERLKMDAVRWEKVNELGATLYLKNIVPPAGIVGFTTMPVQSVPSGLKTRLLSNGFDYYGFDVDTSTTVPADLFFCASHRLNWVFDNGRLIRADVRVWWAREGIASIQTDYGSCADDNTKLNPGGADYDRYHVVYLSTVLKAQEI